MTHGLGKNASLVAELLGDAPDIDARSANAPCASVRRRRNKIQHAHALAKLSLMRNPGKSNEKISMHRFKHDSTYKLLSISCM